MEENLVTTPIFWDKTFENEIAEVYRLFKDQEKKIFDLTWFEENPNGIMDFIEDIIKNNNVFVVKDNDVVAGAFIIIDPKYYKDTILFANVHCSVSKKYWGKKSREVSKCFIKFLKDNFKINKLIAEVPQCGYGIIKLLKNVGFIHEGTIKKVLIYNNKDNEPKLYDKLIYSLDMEDK